MCSGGVWMSENSEIPIFLNSVFSFNNVSIISKFLPDPLENSF